MKSLCRKGIGRSSLAPSRGRPRGGSSTPGRDDEGFTLVELLIVVTVLPLIIGGLTVGLLSVFSLQSSVSNRLSNTADSQMVSSNFANDVQSAQQITTAPNNGSAQCGQGTQLMGLEWNPQGTSGTYSNVVSYVDVLNGSTYSLVRQYCSSGFTTVPPVPGSYTSTTVAYNVLPPCLAGVTTGCQAAPTIRPIGTSTVATDALTAWASTQSVQAVEFPLAAPSSTEVNGKFSYTLAAVPADSASTVATGTALAPAASAGCHSATPGTGTYASTLCLVDFSALTGNNLLAAEQGCLFMAVPLPASSTLYFCLGITGVPVQPSQLPTWQYAFLGNSCGSATSSTCTTGTPFYTGIAGEPALYSTAGGNTTITFSKISVVNAQGIPATGWQAVSADAESTDPGESISWTANVPLTKLPNGETYDTPTDPVGNACNYGGGLTQSVDLMTVTCANPSGGYGGQKNGTAMVSALTPKTLTVNMHGNGLEAAAFGLLLSGA
jgi:prepilin-type N-terminal cleavage/methylation domain-containing protein